MKRLNIILLALGMALMLHAQREKTIRIDETLTIFNDVMRELDVNYVDTLNYEDLIETAINQMLRKVDPYTIYYPKKKDDDLRMMTSGKYGGIGAIIQCRPLTNDTADHDTYALIVNPYKDKPAQKNGLRAGDRILSVDGQSTLNQAVSEVSNNLRGEPGSIVKLEIQREGVDETMHVQFEREDIHLDPVTYYCALKADTLPQPIGYIALREFTEGASKDVCDALNDLYYKQGIQALILDLRGNGGGLVSEAISIVNLFIDKDVEVVSTRGKSARSCHSYKTTSRPLYPDLPLVIMVDKNSASASEIVSGSLQDLGRAKLVGQRTFGKGLVQNVRTIAYGGHLKVTSSKYYLPSGRCIQAIDYAERQRGNALKRDTAGGILPDVVINDSSKLDITYSLYIQNMFFDYATRYHRLHSEIADADHFTLSDEDIRDFCAFLDEKKFTYSTETSKYFDEVIRIAEHEDIDAETLAQLRAMKTTLQPSFRDAIQRNLHEVKHLLGAEIVLRYHYQQGQAAYQLRFDDELQTAIQQFAK